MTGKEAVRRLRAAGWRLVRSNKHALMEKDGQTVTVPLGAKMGRRIESGILRVLSDRVTTGDGYRTSVVVLIALGMMLVACNGSGAGLPPPADAGSDIGSDVVGEKDGVDGGLLDAAPDGVEAPLDGIEALPDGVPADVGDEIGKPPSERPQLADSGGAEPSGPCDPVANTGCAAPLKCGFSCDVGGPTCMTAGTVAPLKSCVVDGSYYAPDDHSCGAGFACALGHCYRYCDTDADCVGVYDAYGVTATCKSPYVPADAGCSRIGYKLCLP